MAQFPPESIDFFINHVILPPKLPQEADNSKIARTAEQHLLKLLSFRIDRFTEQYHTAPNDNRLAFTKAWVVIQNMLMRCATVVSAQNLSTDILTRLFTELKVEGMCPLVTYGLCLDC